MGFGTTGAISIVKNFTNEKIILNLKYNLEIWLYKLNYKNYTEFLFEVDLQLHLHSESKEIDVMTFANDFKQSQIEKNRFILWELITLNGMLEYFKKVIDFYDGKKFGLRNFITQFESDFERIENYKIIEFIELNLNNISIYNDRDFHYFSVEIKNFNKYQILYLHVLMYFDFIKIKDFLNSKFNHNYPIENYQKTNEVTKPETSTPDEVKNPYPDIFKNADYYKKFLEYSKKHIIDAHKDYSYLKKRMQKDKFIFRISDNEFYDFLINKIKVKEKRLIEIYTKEKKFYSQKKSNSEHRLNNYNIVFEIE